MTTAVRATLQPWVQLDVDDAELESLTRQGLLVGVPAPQHPVVADAVVAYVTTSLTPTKPFTVGAAELESLTRQHLVVASGTGGYGIDGYGALGYGI